MTKLETMSEWYERKYGEPLEYIEDLHEFASKNKLLNAYAKLPAPARTVIRRTKKEIKNTFTDKDTGKVRKGRLAAYAIGSAIPGPGGLAVLAGFRGYDEYKNRKNKAKLKESFYYCKEDFEKLR